MANIKQQSELAFSNSLVSGKYNLTKNEQNLIYLVSSQINKNDDEFKRYKVTISDLDLATDSKHDRRTIKELMHSIMCKPIWLNKEHALMCEFHWSLKPHLLGLKGFFTKAELSTMFAFKSKYSSRLYLLLKSELGRQSKYDKSPLVVYDVDDLHNRFSMPVSYKIRYSMFKDRFLSVAVDEINKYTELKVSYDDTSKERKSGRKITSIEFCISEKDKT
jgi:plasmid replication initiation protein